MKQIALIGESPNDTFAIKHLLAQKYTEGYHFFPLLNNIKGSHLDSPKAEKAFINETRLRNPNCIIVIRDADALENENQTKIRRDWYAKFSKLIEKKSVFLLNIYELEALILADIDNFNNHYRTEIKFRGNVSHREKPKEFLQTKTGHKYQVSHCSHLFKHLSFDTIIENCAYFKSFVKEFESAIKN